ncbi:MAG: cell envelope integrity protein TolA [Gammaproteobacteria bacterium]
MLRNDATNDSLWLSIGLHAVVLTLFIVSFELSARNYVLENSDNKSQVVNAVFVNESKIQFPKPTPYQPPKPVEQPKKLIEPTPAAKPPVKVQQEVKKIPEPVIQKKTIVIPDHKKQIQKDLEKQLLADIEQVKKQKKKKKHKDLEKEFAKELKASAAKSLEQQLLSEQSRLSSAQTQKMQGIIDKYKALILQSISQHWLVPSGVDKNLTTQLLIRIAPGGTVLDVQLVKSSGDDSLDRSARTAVFKASPLPVPTNTDEFEPFRQFILKVKPENVIATDAGLN